MLYLVQPDLRMKCRICRSRAGACWSSWPSMISISLASSGPRPSARRMKPLCVLLYGMVTRRESGSRSRAGSSDSSHAPSRSAQITVLRTSTARRFDRRPNTSTRSSGDLSTSSPGAAWTPMSMRRSSGRRGKPMRNWQRNWPATRSRNSSPVGLRSVGGFPTCLTTAVSDRTTKRPHSHHESGGVFVSVVRCTVLARSDSGRVPVCLVKTEPFERRPQSWGGGSTREASTRTLFDSQPRPHDLLARNVRRSLRSWAP